MSIPRISLLGHQITGASKITVIISRALSCETEQLSTMQRDLNRLQNHSNLNNYLNNCDLRTSYGDTNLGQHWHAHKGITFSGALIY